MNGNKHTWRRVNINGSQDKKNQGKTGRQKAEKKKIKARKQAISVGKQIHLEACLYKNRGRPVKPASAGTEITKKEEKNF